MGWHYSLAIFSSDSNTSACKGRSWKWWDDGVHHLVILDLLDVF